MPDRPDSYSRDVEAPVPAIARAVLLALALLVAIAVRHTAAQSLNGFDLSNSSADAEEILSGGPPLWRSSERKGH